MDAEGGKAGFSKNVVPGLSPCSPAKGQTPKTKWEAKTRLDR